METNLASILKEYKQVEEQFNSGLVTIIQYKEALFTTKTKLLEHLATSNRLLRTITE